MEIINRVNEIIERGDFNVVEIAKLLIEIEEESSIKNSYEKYTEFFIRLNLINEQSNELFKKNILRYLDYNIQSKLDSETDIFCKYKDIINSFEVAFYLNKDNSEWVEKRIEVNSYFLRYIDKILYLKEDYNTLIHYIKNKYPDKIEKELDYIYFLKVIIHRELIFKCNYIDNIDEYMNLLKEIDFEKIMISYNSVPQERMHFMFKNFTACYDFRVELINSGIADNNSSLLNKFAMLAYYFSFIESNRQIEKAIKIAPKEGVLYINRALLNLKYNKLDLVLTDIKKALEDDILWNIVGVIDTYRSHHFLLLNHHGFKKVSNYISDNNPIYKYLDLLSKTSNSIEIDKLLIDFIMKLMLEVKLNHEGMSKCFIRGSFRKEYNKSLLEKAYKDSKKIYEAAHDMKYLKIAIKCLICSKEYEKAKEYIFSYSDELDIELKYLLGVVYFIDDELLDAYKIFRELYNEHKTEDNIKMYYNCLYSLGKYDILIDLLKKNELQCSKNIVDENIDIAQKKSYWYGVYLKYEERKEETIDEDDNDKSTKIYIYPLTKIDKEYHDTITFEKKQNEMIELAESYWDLPDEDDGPDWLGGVETEAEFWEHS